MPKADKQHSTRTPVALRGAPGDPSIPATVADLRRHATLAAIGAVFARERERMQIEAEIERLIAQLDALDGDPDAEPDHDGEAEPGECSEVPLHLFTDRVPARRLRAFREPGDPVPQTPPVMPLPPRPNDPPETPSGKPKPARRGGRVRA